MFGRSVGDVHVKSDGPTWFREGLRVRALDQIGKAQVSGVIRHRQEIQGPIQFGFHTVAGGDLLSQSEAKGFLGSEGIAEHSGIE